MAEPFFNGNVLALVKNGIVQDFFADFNSLENDLVGSIFIGEVDRISKDLNSFVDKLFLKFTANELTELSYLDSFGQSVTLEFDEISWKKFDEAKLFIEPPEGIDVVYH